MVLVGPGTGAPGATGPLLVVVGVLLVAVVDRRSPELKKNSPPMISTAAAIAAGIPQPEPSGVRRPSLSRIVMVQSPL